MWSTLGNSRGLEEYFHQADVFSCDVKSGDDTGELHVAMVKADGSLRR